MANPYVLAKQRRAYVQVLGNIWMPAVKAAMQYSLSDYDLENIGEFNRENVEKWLSTHSGDFQSIIDFSAVCGLDDINWQTEENEMDFNTLMYGDRD